MIESKLVSWLALTPALSPGERENRSPVSDKTSRPDRSFTLCSKSPKGGDGQKDFRTTKGSRKLFPLLGGEGQGEGERQTNLASRAGGRA